MKTNITYISAIAFHLFIGIAIYLNEGLSKLYFGIATIYFAYRIIVSHSDSKTFEVLKACAYFVGAEVFFRTTRGAISYEAGKYLVIAFVLMGIFYKGASGKGYPYFISLMFLVPSIFVASTTLSFDVNFRTSIVFVLSGPVCLGIAAMFCYDKHISFSKLSQVLYFMLLPIITHTIYIYFYVPDLQDILSSAVSNRSAAGGFGANQVSAALGLGMFIIAIRLFTESPSVSLKIINALLFAFISFRAITTLSRGGVLVAILSIIVFLLSYYTISSLKKKTEILFVFMIFCLSLVFSWVISNNQTDGLVDLRYANRDHLGREKEDVTTGRMGLFLEEINGFMSNPFFGLGSSRIEDQRLERKGYGHVSHNEFSRLLAEHGMFGVVILIILIFKPFAIRARNRKNYYFYTFMAFWFLTINLISMRIAMPAFIYALALLNVTNEKRPIHRKQIR